MPCQCIRTPNAGVGVQSLHVDGDRGVGRNGIVVVTKGESLGMKTCGFGNKDYGTIQTKSLEL